MEILNAVTEFLTNPWVSWGLTALLTAAGVFLLKWGVQISSAKAIVAELKDISKAHQEAIDPKGEAGDKYSDSERAKLAKEVQDLISVLGDIFFKKDS